jgi:CheY-like chemotaxis protein
MPGVVVMDLAMPVINGLQASAAHVSDQRPGGLEAARMAGL